MAPSVTTLRKRAPEPSNDSGAPTFCSKHPERCQSASKDEDDDDDDDDDDDEDEQTVTSSHSPSATRTGSATSTSSATVSASTTASSIITSITSSATFSTTSSATSATTTSRATLAASVSATAASSSKAHKSAAQKGAIAGGVVGAFIILSALFFLIVFLFRRRIRKRLAPSAEFIHHTGQPPASPFVPVSPHVAGAGYTYARDPEMGEADAVQRHPSLLTPGRRETPRGRLSTDEPPPFTPGGFATTEDQKLEQAADGPISREVLENDHGYGGYGVGMGRH